MRVMAVFHHNFNIFIPFHFFFFFTALCSMQDLSSLRDQTRAPWNGSVESFFFFLLSVESLTAGPPRKSLISFFQLCLCIILLEKERGEIILYKTDPLGFY